MRAHGGLAGQQQHHRLRHHPPHSRTCSIPVPQPLRLTPALPCPTLSRPSARLVAVQVQQLAVPLILQGGDVLVKSETGSGKTLTFLLPLTAILIVKATR